MCGICGIFHFSGQTVDSEFVTRMTDILGHRGPDDQGVYTNGSIGLGHTRLAIIDLSTAARQPMSNEDASIWLTYNGEIYNYRNIKAELITKGHKFRSNTDAEVVVHSYEEWGKACLSKFNGMFAFGIWDERKNLLFLARDRIGIKPLYYYSDKGKLIFASEMKAIIEDRSIPREINLKGLINYFTFGHSVGPATIITDINKLLPNHYLVCKGGKITTEKWWTIPHSSTCTVRGDKLNKKHLEEEEYVRRVQDLLKTSVKARLVSDVPLGAFLSGGIDSSAVVGLMSQLMDEPVKTFSVGFEGGVGYNELDDAKQVAKYFRTDHHELIVGYGELLKNIQKLVYHYDEPFGDAAAFPTYLVSKFARDQVRVVLTGEGADELFGGYRRYPVDRLSKYFQMLPFFFRDRVISKIVDSLPRFRRLKKAVTSMSIPSPPLRYGNWLTIFNDQMKAHLFSNKMAEINFDPYEIYIKYYNTHGSLDHLSRLMYVDMNTWLPDTYLEKVDKASMAAGLEARTPFLDHNLVELAFNVPVQYKVRGFTGKYILKRAMSDLLPKKVLRKRKHGFSVPTDPWFRNELKDFAFEIIMDDATYRRGFLNRNYVEKIYYDHLSGRNVYDYHLWLLLNFELWCRQYLG